MSSMLTTVSILYECHAQPWAIRCLTCKHTSVVDTPQPQCYNKAKVEGNFLPCMKPGLLCRVSSYIKGHSPILLVYICTYWTFEFRTVVHIHGIRLPTAAQQQHIHLAVTQLPYLMSQRLQLWDVIHVCGLSAPWGDLDDVAQAQPHQALPCLIAPKGKRGASASGSQLRDPALNTTTSQHMHLHHTSVRDCHTAYCTVLQPNKQCPKQNPE